MQLKDKAILITGGARVGQYVAEGLLSAGAKVAMTYLKDADEVHKKTKGYQFDATSEENVRHLLPTVEKDFGHIDGLVNMVSTFVPDSSALTFEEIEKQFRVNAVGTMLLSRLFAERVREQGGHNAPIVTFIDWAVDHPYEKYDVYIAAKAALRHYLMALQTTFAGAIRVVNIHPGMILEPEGFPTHDRKSIQSHTPTREIGTPQQAAQLVRAALELDFLVDNIRLAGGQQWRHRL